MFTLSSTLTHLLTHSHTGRVLEHWAFAFLTSSQVHQASSFFPAISSIAIDQNLIKSIRIILNNEKVKILLFSDLKNIVKLWNIYEFIVKNILNMFFF